MLQALKFQAACIWLGLLLDIKAADFPQTDQLGLVAVHWEEQTQTLKGREKTGRSRRHWIVNNISRSNHWPSCEALVLSHRPRHRRRKETAMRGQAALCAAQDKKAFFSANPWECLIFFGTVEISTQYSIYSIYSVYSVYIVHIYSIYSIYILYI